MLLTYLASVLAQRTARSSLPLHTSVSCPVVPSFLGWLSASAGQGCLLHLLKQEVGCSKKIILDKIRSHYITLHYIRLCWFCKCCLMSGKGADGLWEVHLEGSYIFLNKYQTFLTKYGIVCPFKKNMLTAGGQHFICPRNVGYILY